MQSHPYLVNLESRKDYQQVKDYEYLLTDKCIFLSGFVDRETELYSTAEFCFEALIAKIGAYEARGYRLKEIKNNKYFLEDSCKDEIYRVLIITKKLRK